MTDSDVRPPSPRFSRGQFLPLIVFHLAAIALPFWTGVSPASLLLCAALYGLQMFGVTAGYHRYFSHRSYETGPAQRAVLSFLSVSSLQRPVRWWAARHRDHHRFSDTAPDLHSPVVHGLLRSHFLWPFYSDAMSAESHVHDLDRFPEVVWIDRLWRLPFFVLAAGCWLLLGWQGVVVGLFWSTLLVYHATGTINSLAHVLGWRRYATSDRSRNNFVLALITMGEGWHNNHHYYPSSCRQGFWASELDLTWLVLRMLERIGLVWNLRETPARLLGDQAAREP